MGATGTREDKDGGGHKVGAWLEERRNLGEAHRRRRGIEKYESCGWSRGYEAHVGVKLRMGWTNIPEIEI